MTSARREQLIKALQDKEYRELYAEEHIKTGLAFQIRALREARNWTQAELGSESGKSQVVISQLEDPDYGKFQLRTLLTLAAAFDVALIARFAPYSELLDRTLNLAPEHLAPPNFAEEQSIQALEKLTTSTDTVTAASTGDPAMVNAATLTGVSILGYAEITTETLTVPTGETPREERTGALAA